MFGAHKPRIPPVTQLTAEQRDLLAKTIASPEGKPLNIFATMAHHPLLLKRFNILGGLFLAHGELPARERELVILRVAWGTRSVYEFGQHTLIGQRNGLSETEIASLADTLGDGDWAERDRALLEFVDELLAHETVSDERWSSVAIRWTDQQMLELVMLIGFYRMVAGFLNSVGVEPEQWLPLWPR